MKKKRKSGKAGKWLIFSVGLLFALYTAFLLVLHVFGTGTQARLTSYRQEYGERNETIRNVYTYEFGYEFTVDGKTYSGTGQKTGSPVFLKPTKETTIAIKYLSCCPYLNTASNGKKTWINILIMALVSVVLFWFSRKM